MARRPRTPPPPPRGQVYTWSASFQPFKNSKGADPQVIGEALDAIAQQHGGNLKPRQIWEAAQAPRHPLHRHFEWNERRAAEAHWDTVSRVLTRSIMILADDKNSNQPPRRAWISVPDDGYQRVAKVMDETDLQLAVMRRALADLESWIDRYGSLQNICGNAIVTARTALQARLAASVRA
jgi:hypothetical protein